MTTMVPYEVCDKAAGDRFYVLAETTQSAIEQVTLALTDRPDAPAWEAVMASPALTLVQGVVFDASRQTDQGAGSLKAEPPGTNVSSPTDPSQVAPTPRKSRSAATERRRWRCSARLLSASVLIDTCGPALRDPELRLRLG